MDNIFIIIIIDFLLAEVFSILAAVAPYESAYLDIHDILILIIGY